MNIAKIFTYINFILRYVGQLLLPSFISPIKYMICKYQKKKKSKSKYVINGSSENMCIVIIFSIAVNNILV